MSRINRLGLGILLTLIVLTLTMIASEMAGMPMWEVYVLNAFALLGHCFLLTGEDE